MTPHTFQPSTPDGALKEAIREIQVMSGVAERSRPEADQQCITVGVTSPDYGDGKTTVSIALAGSLSEDYEAEVTLVDADFHTHSVGKDFGLIGRAGLSEIVNGTHALEAVTNRVSRTSMSIVTAGTTPTDPARLARSRHLVTLIENMKRTSRYVVIDLPASLRSMNTPILARHCDGVIVVVRHGHTTTGDLERTLHLLRDANVLGVVVNRQKSKTPAWVQRTLNLRG